MYIKQSKLAKRTKYLKILLYPSEYVIYDIDALEYLYDKNNWLYFKFVLDILSTYKHIELIVDNQTGLLSITYPHK